MNDKRIFYFLNAVGVIFILGGCLTVFALSIWRQWADLLLDLSDRTLRGLGLIQYVCRYNHCMDIGWFGKKIWVEM